MQKREFLKLSALGAVASSLSLTSLAAPAAATSEPEVMLDIPPISKAERQQRIQKAQQLMQQLNIDALVLEPGAAMDYFSGIQWWRSERLTSVVIPREGELLIVCPFFEEPSVRESLMLDSDIQVWQEDQSPFGLIAQFLKARKLGRGKVAFEHTVRFFVVNGLMSLLPEASQVAAEPVTLGCRMYKSQHELQLMHKASEITLMAYNKVFAELQPGMTQNEVKALMNQTQQQLGGSSPWCLALFNDASAYPHGTHQQQRIKPGSVVLLDSGCAFAGYQSDISRTLVMGDASKKVRSVWDTVRKGQQIAFDSARAGTPAGRIDDNVRAFYQMQGFGPDYQLPGLSHRTGHGIGMEGHESVNFVRGEKTVLAKGMCLSNEPGIYLPGEFGVRLEDCIYMGQDSAHWFTEPPASLDEPLGRLVPLQTI